MKKTIRLFASPIGQEALDELKELYCDGPIVDDNVTLMTAKAGQHDLIMEIVDAVKLSKEGGGKNG